MGDGYKNRGSNAAGLGFKNRGAKLLDGAAYVNRGATDGTHETFKNRGQAWGTGVFYNRSVSDFASLSILGSAAFYAPLKSSLILTRGTGNPTFTRATSAWEFDNEGKLATVASGAARFGGARMVRNLLTYTEDLSNAAWTKTRVTISQNAESDINGLVTADKIVEDSTASSTHFVKSYTPAASNLNDVFSMSFYIKAGERSKVGLWSDGGSPRAVLDINLISGTITPSTVGDRVIVNSSITAVGNGWYRVVLTTRSPTSSTASIYLFLQDDLGNVNYNGDGTSGVYLWGAQLENVTGQADQTASEYVSAGVLSAPFHGAGVDGVKWFNTNKDGSAISESSLLGYHAEGSRTNSLLYSRDLTNAAWAATNITPAKTATGIDNVANSASTITAGAADATILQTLTLAAAARSSSAYVKRRTGSGNIYMTRDGGTNWTDITSSVGASWTRVKIENTSVLNPSVGFKIATSGDAIDVDVVQDEAGAFISSPIITTTASVTRNADALTYATASNWSDTAGWALASVYKPDWSYVAGGVIGSATNGLLPLTTNTGAKAYDGTNTVNGPAGSPSGTVKMAMNWGSGALQVAANGTVGTAGSYDGAWGLASIGINTSAGAMYTKNVYIAQAALTATQLAQVTS